MSTATGTANTATGATGTVGATGATGTVGATTALHDLHTSTNDVLKGYREMSARAKPEIQTKLMRKQLESIKREIALLATS